MSGRRQVPAEELFATLKAAKDALHHEAAMIEAVADRLGTPFVDAVDLLYRCRGHVIVSGLGKSGHVGRKIASTLACTGTPALFVHAAEALHGDSGVLLPADVLIAVSYSGETAEAVSFARIARARGAKVIALAGSQASELCRQADVSLDVAVEREADPLNLAPTASATAAMALGDALAVALMILRGFRAEDFIRNHPGGILGTIVPGDHSPSNRS